MCGTSYSWSLAWQAYDRTPVPFYLGQFVVNHRGNRKDYCPSGGNYPYSERFSGKLRWGQGPMTCAGLQRRRIIPYTGADSDGHYETKMPVTTRSLRIRAPISPGDQRAPQHINVGQRASYSGQWLSVKGGGIKSKLHSCTHSDPRLRSESLTVN